MDTKQLIDIKQQVRDYLWEDWTSNWEYLCDEKYADFARVDILAIAADSLIPDGKIDPEFEAKLFNAIKDQGYKEQLQDILRPLKNSKEKESKSSNEQKEYENVLASYLSEHPEDVLNILKANSMVYHTKGFSIAKADSEGLDSLFVLAGKTDMIDKIKMVDTSALLKNPCYATLCDGDSYIEFYDDSEKGELTSLISDVHLTKGFAVGLLQRMQGSNPESFINAIKGKVTDTLITLLNGEFCLDDTDKEDIPVPTYVVFSVNKDTGNLKLEQFIDKKDKSVIAGLLDKNDPGNYHYVKRLYVDQNDIPKLINMFNY